MNNVNNPMLGITTQTDVTASRAIDGTVYHNTGTKPIFVLVCIYTNATSLITVKSDSAANPTLVVATVLNQTAAVQLETPITFIVLPGNYYKITLTISTGTLQTWIEYT